MVNKIESKEVKYPPMINIFKIIKEFLYLESLVNKNRFRNRNFVILYQ